MNEELIQSHSSPTLGKLAEALAKAQGEMHHAAKDKANPFFKSTYADLASVWDACREPLSKNGLCVIQPLHIDGGKLVLETKLVHSSGEWIMSTLPILPVDNKPQSVGSAITYMRRFALSALVGIAPSEKATEADTDDDDDGNAASGRVVVGGVKKPTPDQLNYLIELSKTRGLKNRGELKALIYKEFGYEDGINSLLMQDYYSICSILNNRPVTAQEITSEKLS